MPGPLDQEELNVLMSAIKEGRVGQAPDRKAAVLPYDLTSQDRIIRGQMPTLDSINERIASMAASGLGGRTRTALRVTTSPATLLKFSDVQVLLAPPTTVAVLNLGHSLGMALAILEPTLTVTLLGAALGDRQVKSDGTEAPRELTSVDKLVLRRLLGVLTEAMGVAWAGTLPLAPEVMRFETDPRLCAIAPPNEVAVLSSFELSGGVAGRLQIAFPYAAVEPVRKILSAPPRMTGGGDARFARSMAAEMENVEVELTAMLGTTRLTLERLLSLSVGEVLTLDTGEGSPLSVQVEGRAKLRGMPGVRSGALAITLGDTTNREGPATTLAAGRNAA